MEGVNAFSCDPCGGDHGEDGEKDIVLPGQLQSQEVDAELLEQCEEQAKSPRKASIRASSANHSARLFAAKATARRHRRHVTVTCFMSGGIMLLLGTGLAFSYDPLINGIGLLLTGSSLHAMLLGVLPMDRNLITAAALICGVVWVMVCVTWCSWALIPCVCALLGRNLSGEKLTKDDDEYRPYLDANSVGTLVVLTAMCALFELFFVGVAIASSRAICKLQPRDLLGRIWKYLMCSDIAGLTFFGLAVVMSFVAPDESSVELEWKRRIRYFLICLMSSTFAWLISRPSSRARAQGFLASRGEVVGGAAALASMISGCDIAALEADGQRLFRYIPFDKVTRQAMVEDASALDGANGLDTSLYQLTATGDLGEVDAFISHSWHDPPEEKFAELSRWCANFKTKHGRVPKLWIDKYCINQTDLQTNLRCLPIFLAGCERVIIMWGKTYPERLWCVVELYVFLQMGGSPDNLDVILLDGIDDQRITESIEAFSMKDIKAFSRKDLCHLLSMMEAAAAGDPGTLIQEMLREAIVHGCLLRHQSIKQRTP